MPIAVRWADERPDLPGHRIERREGGVEDVVTQMGRTRQAAALGLVPAVSARVLATRHAEVERLVKGVELLAGSLSILFAAGVGKRFVERGLIAEDVVPETLGQDPDLGKAPDAGRRSLEGVACAAPFAE